MRTKTVAGWLSGALLASAGVGVRAGAKHNPYEVIVTRNAFGLKPPPPPAGPPAPPTPALDVFLPGVSTVGGRKEVLLEAVDKAPGKAPEFLPPLEEKDVQGRIEVISIDAKKGMVVIEVDHTARTLTFDKSPPKSGGPIPVPQSPKPYLHAAASFPLPLRRANVPVASSHSGDYGVVVGGAGGGNPNRGSLAFPTGLRSFGRAAR